MRRERSPDLSCRRDGLSGMPSMEAAIMSQKIPMPRDDRVDLPKSEGEMTCSPRWNIRIG